MRKFRFALAVLTACATFAAACDDGDEKVNDPVPEVIHVTEVKVTPASSGVVAGETLQLEAEVLPENATDKSITWGSRDPKIATVDENGLVTGVAVGEVQVYAVSTDGKKSGICNVTVTAAPVRVETVTLNKETLTLFVGKQETLTAEVKPDDATDKTVVWASSDETIATVDQNGTVTAVAEGKADITATADEKSAKCEVTVSIPAIESITLPYLKDVVGSKVTMTGAGFKTGDVVKIEAVAGDEYTMEVPVIDVKTESAAFELPADIARDRSYKLTILRESVAQAVVYLRPDDRMVRLPYALGYYMTGENEVVPTDAAMHGSGDNPQLVRRGYMPGKIVELDEETKDFMVWKADAALTTLTFANNTFDLTYATGVTSIKPFTDLFGKLAGVTRVYVANSNLTELDMTQFPDATLLHAWGDPGSHLNKIANVNFGTVGTDPACLLGQIQLERQSITGTLDLRNCTYLQHFSCQDNQIEKIEFGTANVDTPLAIYDLNAENNQIREFSAENLGQVRTLKLAGNPIERLTLLNNSKMESPTHITMQQYVYIFKTPQCFTLSWASAADAKGERHFNVEEYWWRVYSEGNSKENTDNGFPEFEGGWVEANPIVKALADGVKVTCWTYHGEGGPDAHAIHTHEGGTTPCNYPDYTAN